MMQQKISLAKADTALQNITDAQVVEITQDFCQT